MRVPAVFLLLAFTGPAAANPLRGPDANRTIPVRTRTTPMRNLFCRGFASMPMSPRMRQHFGPGGRGLRWLDLAPDGLIFFIPLHPGGEWKFFSSGPAAYHTGKNPVLDLEFDEGLAPLAREYGQEALAYARQHDPSRDYRLLQLVAVKSFDGLGAGMWHTDEQWDTWDARAVGVGPFGVNEATLVYDEGVAYQPPVGNVVFFEARRWHMGVNTPGVPRFVLSADFKAPLY